MSRPILSCVLTTAVILTAIRAPALGDEAWNATGPNLVKNPSFDNVSDGGIPSDWRASRAYYCSDDSTAHQGDRCVKYENDDPSKYVFCNQVLKVCPGAAYRIRAWIKTKEIAGEESGATICLEWRDAKGKHIAGCYPKGVKGTADWTLVEGISPPLPEEAASMVIQCYVRRNMTGTAWFDDVEVVRVRRQPMDSVILSPIYRGRITKDGPKAARVGVSVALADYEDIRPEGVVLQWQLLENRSRKAVDKGSVEGAAFRTSFDTDEGYVFDVPTGSLAVGDYTLRLRLLDQSGKELDTAEHRLTRVPDDFEPVAKIDEHHRLIVRGKPFFPIGMYCGRLNEKDLKIFSDSRFNCMMPYGTPTREEMDLADRHGIKVLYSIKDWYYGHHGCPKSIKSIEEEEPAVRKRVREMKDHPALLAWYLNDELPLRFMPQLDAHQRLVEEEDPGPSDVGGPLSSEDGSKLPRIPSTLSAAIPIRSDAPARLGRASHRRRLDKNHLRSDLSRSAHVAGAPGVQLGPLPQPMIAKAGTRPISAPPPGPNCGA